MLAIPAKYRSPWLQLAVFICFAAGLFFTLGAFGSALVARANGLSLDEVQLILEGKSKSAAARNVLAGLQMVQFLTLFIIPSLLFALWADPGRAFRFSGFNRVHHQQYFLYALLLVPLSMPATALIGWLNQQIPLPQSLVNMEAKQNAAVGLMAVAKDSTQLLVSLFLIGVLAGVGEELFFRGILQRIVIQIFKNPWAGIIVTAALFSAFHFQFSGFLVRMMLGVVLGALYWYSGSLWPGILFHFVYNSLGVLLAYFNPENLNKAENLGGNLAAVFAGGAVCLAGIVYLVKQMRVKTKTTYAQIYPDRAPTPFD